MDKARVLVRYDKIDETLTHVMCQQPFHGQKYTEAALKGKYNGMKQYDVKAADPFHVPTSSRESRFSL